MLKLIVKLMSNIGSVMCGRQVAVHVSVLYCCMGL